MILSGIGGRVAQSRTGQAGLICASLASQALTPQERDVPLAAPGLIEHDLSGQPW